MQQDNKFSFINPTNSEIMLYSDDFCKRLLGHCQRYLNNYIKFLVPPQESCCEQLRQFLTDHDTEEILPRDTAVRFGSDTDLEANKDEFTPIASVTSTKTLSPTKVCRFAEVDDVVPSYEETIAFDEGKDEVDTVYVPEPFKFPEKATTFTFEPGSLPSPKIRAFSVPFSRIGFDTPEIRDHHEPQSDVIFLGDPSESPIFPKAHAKVYTPTTPIILEKAPSIPHIRPKYTTQVSTLSTRSNTISLYSCWPPPIGIILISVLEILLFILNEKRPTSTGRHTHGHIADALIFDPSRRQEAWRFITYLFVHIGYQHLLFNLAVQIFLGVILEMVHERWRVLTIYFAGILAGSLGTSVFNPRVKLAGASGGVYALITAHIVTVILKWKYMQYPPTQLLGFLIVIVTDLATGIHSAYQNKIEDISYVAHGCGALAGVLVGFPVLRKLSEDKKVRWFQYVGVIVFFFLILGSVVWNIAATGFFPKSEA